MNTLDWFAAAKTLLEADEHEDSDKYQEGRRQLRGLVDAIESAMPPGLTITEYLLARGLVLSALDGEVAMSENAIQILSAAVAKTCQLEFKRGEAIWKEAAHRKMEELRAVMSMEIAIEKAELVELLRKDPSGIASVPTHEMLVTLFNQPTPPPHIHVLRSGKSLCPMSWVFGIPGTWPEDHKWISAREDLVQVTCTVCRRLFL